MPTLALWISMWMWMYLGLRLLIYYIHSCLCLSLASHLFHCITSHPLHSITSHQWIANAIAFSCIAIALPLHCIAPYRCSCLVSLTTWISSLFFHPPLTSYSMQSEMLFLEFFSVVFSCCCSLVSCFPSQFITLMVKWFACIWLH